MNTVNNTNTQEVIVTPKKRRPRTLEVTSEGQQNWKAVAEETQEKLTLATNKVNELTKIVESMKGQYAQLEKTLNNERVKNQATKDYMLDTLKHAYISATMAAKQGV